MEKLTGISGKIIVKWKAVRTEIEKITVSPDAIPLLCQVEQIEDPRERQLSQMELTESWKSRVAQADWLIPYYDHILERLNSGKLVKDCLLYTSIINEKLTETTIDWSEERFDEEGSLLTRSNMAAVCLNYFEEWGWLRKDYDETLNSYVVSFPEYSQLYVELFQKLYKEEDSSERESVLAVYSYLFTYSSDAEKNNEILESALQTSRRLSRMLGNMREGMRGYFDELSRQRDFRGIQEVLVKEINNSDSKKYAILTTTDSFYRYKEAVKELIDQNLSENELRQQELEQKIFSLSLIHI